jgi:hypothetical protein
MFFTSWQSMATRRLGAVILTFEAADELVGRDQATMDA